MNRVVSIVLLALSFLAAALSPTSPVCFASPVPSASPSSLTSPALPDPSASLTSPLSPASPVPLAQFGPADLADRARWEAFLREARVVSAEHMGANEGITEPWKLLLEKDGVTRHALWKNPRGTQLGYLEGWKFEIAAYELDKLLGVGMVPPTVEKRFRGQAGSCQLWIEDTILLMQKLTDSPGDPSFHTVAWKRKGYIAHLFDNLIANEDRHARNILVTADNCCLLIDHSRSFRTTRAFTEDLLFTERKMREGEIMRELPRALVERVRSLTEDDVKAAVGAYLSAREIRAVMARHALLLAEIDRLIAKYGEGSVLY